jgi:hypothetical protein
MVEPNGDKITEDQAVGDLAVQAPGEKSPGEKTGDGKTADGTNASSTFVKVPLLWTVIVAICMFGAALWGGGEIARGEIAQQQLDLITAKGRVVKAKITVPPGAVVTAEMVEEVDAYANRVEPYCLNRAALVIGKKTRYGLESGQVVIVKDLQ